MRDDQIKQLYILANKFKIPMTKLVRMAVAEYLVKYNKGLDKTGKVKGNNKGSLKTN